MQDQPPDQEKLDGLTIHHNAAGHWKRFAYFCHWPTPETPS